MKAMFKFLKNCMLLVIAVLMVTAIGYAEAPKKGGDFVAIYQPGSLPAHFNCGIKSGAAIAFPGAQIFASLVEIDDKWKPIPYLAKSWEISEDGETYTFHLVEDAVFHDGQPVTSEDVAFSLEIVKENHPFGAYMFEVVDRVKTPDKHTVVIELDDPSPALMMALSPALMPILPKHVYGDGQPIRTHPANAKPIGCGPFKLAKFEPGEYFILERNPNYFRKGLPYLDRIIGRVVDDINAAIITMKQGKGHSLGYLNDPHKIKILKKSKNLKLYSAGYEGIAATYFLEFNLRRDTFKDVRVRQAIAYAMDLDFITKKLHMGFTRKATGPIHSKTLFYTDQVKTYPLDLEKANQLLDEAGFPRKDDGMRFSATLEWFPGSDMKNVAEYLKPQLKKVGIDIQLKAPAGFLPWMMRIGNWKHDLTLNNYFMWGDPMIGVHRIFHSGNIRKQVWTNTSGYKNRKVDKLLEAAAEEMDFEKRKALYAEFQRIISEDLPLYFTYEAPYHTAYHKDLRNVPIPSIWGAATPNDKIYWKNGRAPR